MKRTSSLLSLVLLLSLLLMLTSFMVAGASAPNDGPWVASVDLPAIAVRFDTEFYNGKMYLLGFRTRPAPPMEASGCMTLPSTPGATPAWTCPCRSPTTRSPSSPMPMASGCTSSAAAIALLRARMPFRCIIRTQTPRRRSPPTLGPAGQPGERVFPGGVVAVGNKAYAWGGFCGTTTDPFTGSQTWIYDPSAAAGSRWTAGPDLPAPGAYQNGAVLDGKVYSIGGDSYDGASLIAYADVVMLDPANLGAGWQAKASIPTPSSGTPGCDKFARVWLRY